MFVCACVKPICGANDSDVVAALTTAEN
jgi:hypothetical protein